METFIKQIQLKKILHRYYFKISMVDTEGHSYTIDKPFSSSPIQFRKQVFGLMSAIGSFDLLRLATSSPVYKPVKGYYMNGLQILENEKGGMVYFSSTKKGICLYKRRLKNQGYFSAFT